MISHSFPFRSPAILAAVMLLWAVGTLRSDAQEENAIEDKSPAASLQETLKQWVLTRQLISREKAAWEEQKKTWTNLNEIRRIEKEQLDEFATAARSRVPEIIERKSSLTEEEKALREWRKESLRKVDEWEKKLMPLLPLFPTPLVNSLQEPIERLKASTEAEEGIEPRPLQDRTRDVALILQGFREFQDTITSGKELLSIGNANPREVDVLYLGLNRAWFVDASNSISGYGNPTRKGWVWTEDPSVASEVRRAIEMNDNRISPEFLPLPFPAHEEGQL